MAFLSNNKIKVFPTAFRGQDASGHAIDPGSFLTTEENFVNIANKVTYLHKDYFYVDGNIAYIILGGYYFVANVSDIQALFTNPANGDEIWAGINVADFGSAYESTSVKTLTPNGGSAGETLDDSTNFKGLTFLGKNDSKDGFTYKLKLFKRVSNAWAIEESSQLNISTNQIENGNSSTPITKSFSTNTLSASSISANSISASFIATNELVAYSNGIITQSIFGPSQMVIGTSGTLSLYASSIYTQGDILPYANDVYNLGSIGSRFQSLYVNDILNPGDINIIADTGIIGGGYTGVLNLEAGSYISLNGTANTHSIYPNATNTYNLGTSSKYYKGAYINNAYLSHIMGSQIFMEATSSIILGGYSGISTNIYIGTDLSASVATPYLTGYTAIGGSVTEIAGNGTLIQLGSATINLSTDSGTIVFKGDPKGVITHGAKSITDSDFVKSGNGTTWNNAFADTGARKHVTWSRVGESVRISLKLNNPNQSMSRWLWHRISLNNLAKIVGSSSGCMTSPSDYLTCVGNVISNSSASDGSISWRVEGTYLYFIVGDGNGYPTGVSLDISFNLNDY